MRAIALFALLAAVGPLAVAQRAASAHAAAPARPAASHVNGFAFGRGAHFSGLRRSGFQRSFTYPYAPYAYASLPFPFFGDSFDPADIYSTGYPVASEPPAYVLQAAQEMLNSASLSPQPNTISRDRRETQSSEPLMIELQDGRYVRVSRTATNGEALNWDSSDARSVTSTRNQSDRPPIIAAAPSNNLTPTVLVFRDGHSEEVRDYAIADGILYARGDYYTDGYWNKKIELSSLNLSQTQQTNASRNVRFTLPSSPNEVITRP